MPVRQGFHNDAAAQEHGAFVYLGYQVRGKARHPVQHPPSLLLGTGWTAFLCGVWFCRGHVRDTTSTAKSHMADASPMALEIIS